MYKYLMVIVALSLLLVSCGQETPVQEQMSGADAMSEASLANNIKILASDEFEGRAPNSAGEEITVNFLENAFREAGLEPANGNSYIQDVPMVSIAASPSASLSISGGSGDVLDLSYMQEQVIWTRRMTENINVENSEVVFVGYGINAPERGWNDYEGIDVTGKTVVMLVNDPGYATQDEALFDGNSMTYYGRWDYKYDEAARQGAVGAIIIHDTEPAAYPFSIVQSSWTGARLSLERAAGEMSPTEFEGWITHDRAVALFDKASLDLITLEAASSKQGFNATPMNLTANVAIENTIERVNSRNVAGILKGSEVSDEVFLYMAHWDHFGIGPEINGDNIYNGAYDNASGTAGLLELVKAYASMPENASRSILFLATTAEEQGLFGAAYYAAHPLAPLNKTVGGLNIDGLNVIGPTKDVTIVGFGNSQLDAYLEQEASKTGKYLRPDPEPEKGYFYRADHFELAKVGVPMIYPNAGIDHVEKGEEYGRAVSEEYVRIHYHQPTDEYSEEWDLAGAVADLRLYFAAGLAVANSKDWPKWSDGSEFKAVREKQLAE